MGAAFAARGGRNPTLGATSADLLVSAVPGRSQLDGFVAPLLAMTGSGYGIYESALDPAPAFERTSEFPEQPQIPQLTEAKRRAFVQGTRKISTRPTPVVPPAPETWAL